MLAANYANYANGARKIFLARHSRNSRNSRLLLQEDERYGFSGYGLFGSDDAEAFHGLCFDVYGVGRNTEDFGDSGLHLGKKREQLRPLRKNVRIDVPDLVAFLADVVCGLSQELQTRDALEAVIGIRKHLADISEPACAQQ